MRERVSLFLGGLLLLFFLISFVLFLFNGMKESEKVFFFPDMISGQIKGETRELPARKNLEKAVEIYVRDLALGPMNLNFARLLPQSTTVNSVLLRKGVLYLDFSKHFLLAEEGEVPLSFGEIIDNVKRSVMFNFKQIKEVKITINGQEPHPGSV